MIPVMFLFASIGRQQGDQLSFYRSIDDGPMPFFRAEYFLMLIYMVIFSIIHLIFTDYTTTSSFVVGAMMSIACGRVGMKIAMKTMHQCCKDLNSGFDVAIRGFYWGACFLRIHPVFRQNCTFNIDQKMYERSAGYGLDEFSIDLFSRVGPGSAPR